MSFVDAGAVDFDMAVNLTRGVGQTMARLADWEVSTLVSRVEEMEARRGGHRLAGRLRAAADRRGQPALRAAARLRLAPPPRRGRRPDRGDGRQGRGPPHHRRHRRLRRPGVLHRAVQHARPRRDRRPRRGLREPLPGRRRALRRPDHQEPRRLGALRDRRRRGRRSRSPRGSSTSSVATPRCPTYASGWPADR